MELVNEIQPWVHPIEMVVDHPHLLDSTMALLDRIGVSIDWINHV